MTPAQDVDSEHQKMILKSPDPSASQNSGKGAQIEAQERLSQLRVEVTVLRAHNIPHIKRPFGRKRRFYVTVTGLVTAKKTEIVQIDGQTVQWNQTLDVFSTQPSSHLTLCLYEKRLAHRDVVIGAHEIPIPAASQIDVPFVISNGNGDVGRSRHQVILHLTINLSANAPPPIIPNNLPVRPAKEDDTQVEEATKTSIPPDSGGPVQSTASQRLPSSPDPLSAETVTPILDGQTEMSERAQIALRHADEAKKPTNGADKWKGVISRIKWVMDTVSPIAGLHPFAKMAYDLVLVIPETILEQYGRDDNVLSLLEAMHDAFDFAHHEDTLKSIKPDMRTPKRERISRSLTYTLDTRSVQALGECRTPSRSGELSRCVMTPGIAMCSIKW